MIDVIVPNLGFPPGDQMVLSTWLVGLGDDVIEGDRLVELIIGELTFDISSPASGRLSTIGVECDEVVSPGEVLGTIQPLNADEC